jgi:hypothetical protein
VEQRRFELLSSSLQARRSSVELLSRSYQLSVVGNQDKNWQPITDNEQTDWFRGADSNRWSPVSQSGAFTAKLPRTCLDDEGRKTNDESIHHYPSSIVLPLSSTGSVPCRGVEPQFAGSEPGVLPLDEHGMFFLGAPRETRTPGPLVRSQPLCSAELWVRAAAYCLSGCGGGTRTLDLDHYERPALASELPRNGG